MGGREPVDAEVIEDVSVGEVVHHMLFHRVGLDLGHGQDHIAQFCLMLMASRHKCHAIPSVKTSASCSTDSARTCVMKF